KLANYLGYIDADDEVAPVLRLLSSMGFSLRRQGGEIARYMLGDAEGELRAEEVALWIAMVTLAQEAKKAKLQANLRTSVKLAARGAGIARLISELRSKGLVREEHANFYSTGIIESVLDSETQEAAWARVLSTPELETAEFATYRPL
ncbi:MAG: hypothetical protein KC560_07575, partial [Myxococcales bacterium]|nr:hypothetical protein [Myxococcales bacterium]